MTRLSLQSRPARLLLLCLIMATAPACIKYYDLSKTEFPQGTKAERPEELIRENVRTARVYDQFQTCGIFDALWLSDDVRTYFAHQYTKKRGKDEQTTEAFVRRQLEENRHWISFYLLADVRNRANDVLSDKNAAWTVSLAADDKPALEAISIKEVEVEPEYQALLAPPKNLFDEESMHFKKSYLVRFSAAGIGDEEHYLEKTKALRLTVASPTHQAVMIWERGATPLRPGSGDKNTEILVQETEKKSQKQDKPEEAG